MAKSGPKPARRLEIDAGNYKPRMPAGLHAHGQRLWRAVVPVLSAAGTLTPLDQAGLETMCVAYAVAREAAEQLASDGGTHRDERGILRKHPAFQVWRDAQATFRAWANEFGLTPAARRNLPAADNEGNDLATLLEAIAGAGAD